MSRLFSPIQFRETVIKNRIFVSPMCQYSAVDGIPDHWHLVHLGSRAVGGAGLVMAEATAVSPEGRITHGDLGIWSDAHTEAFKPITDFIRAQGAVPAIQIAHAGRKASTEAPWLGSRHLPLASGGWETLAPSAISFSPEHAAPRALTIEEIKVTVQQFVDASHRALSAGFDVIELHFAHGYLVNEFLSPLTNQRSDEYGGSLENRCRLPLEIARQVRDSWPQDKPIFARISATDWVDGGWDIEQSVQLSKWLKEIGIDLIDCSSGGNAANARIPAGPGYQTQFAERIRAEAGIATGAVGMITSAFQAEHILVTEQADAVFLARELLREPYWPLHAARELHVDLEWPLQYARAKTK